ncbi:MULTISPECIES: DUF4271 domain-containing protein [unclassified Saccharicrinis]|uniref:DUF4271 domain-containing protein n=1 Tax=unclassified Saccharicrinis TaxID=2646859 RepID=UPI003D335368
MKNTRVNISALKQDTVKVNRESISIELPSVNQVKVDAPKGVAEIPEVPKRFQKPKQNIKPKEVVFIPSAKDSIEFNLKTRITEGEGVLTNTVVRDFLEPIPRSDKQWIAGETTQGIADYQVSPDEIKTVGTDRAQVSRPAVIQRDTSVSLSTINSKKLTTDSSSVLINQPASQMAETVAENIDHKFFKESDYAKDVLTGLLILSVAITGVIRLTNFKFMRELFSSVVFGQFARKMLKTESLRNQKAAFALNALFLFNAALFIYEYVSYNQINVLNSNGLLIIPIAMAVVLGFGLIKGLLYRFVAYVFECKQKTGEYIFYARLHDKIFGLVILPVILVIPYIDESMVPMLLNLGIGVFVLLYLIQLFRGLTIILKNVASLFYMFLYLCALEILPLVIMYNILNN